MPFGQVRFWRRPGKSDPGWSATTNYRDGNCLHVFSCNADPFEKDTSYKPFAGWALLYHGGDFSAAASRICANDWGSVPQFNEVIDDSGDLPPKNESALRGKVPASTFGPDRDHPEPGPRIAYLWKGQHSLEVNVPEEDRLKRAAAVTEMYALLPASGFLPAFVATYLPTTDVSVKLLVGAAFSAAASVLSRNVYLVSGGRRLYPNLWAALIAGSGQRKSTAVNMVAEFLRSDAALYRRVVPSDSTLAAFAQTVGIEVNPDLDGGWDYAEAEQGFLAQTKYGDKGIATLCVDEIGGWLRQLGLAYNAGFKEILTGAFEAPPAIRRETKQAGTYYLPKPCINLVGASTPIWLEDNINRSDIQGGFLGRFTFFISTQREYKLPMCDAPDLLKAHDAAGGVLDEPALTGAYRPQPGAGEDQPTGTERAGARIGSYKLLQKLGEGGMGTVWVAEQSEPVKRRVALTRFSNPCRSTLVCFESCLGAVSFSPLMWQISPSTDPNWGSIIRFRQPGYAQRLLADQRAAWLSAQTEQSGLVPVATLPLSAFVLWASS